MLRAKSDLRPAQNRIATHLYENNAVQAVVGMGGGKTAAAMTAIRELIDDGVIRCALVLAPKRVAQLVWTKEHLLWEHLCGLKVRHVTGTPTQRNSALFDIGSEPADVYVVGVDNTKWLTDVMKDMQVDYKLFDLLCIDELSRFKAERGKRARELLKLANKKGPKCWPIRWGLTGTPRPNGYIDQFRPLTLLTQYHIWGKDFDKWRNRYFIAEDHEQRDWRIREEWGAKIKEDISRFSVTVSDEDMPYLEPITPVFHWVDLPPKAMTIYKDMERKLLAQFKDGNVLAANAAVASGKLSQAANGYMYTEDGYVEYLHTLKGGTLADLIEGVGGEPVMIGYEYREGLRTLQEMLPGLRYFGAGTKDAEAAENETLWNRRELPWLGLHPASAGHGLNLQYGGSQFIWMEMPWSAELYDQTLKRFHRPGQTRRCFAHHILARGTIDEAKYDRVANKITEQEAFRRYLKTV